MSTSSLHYTPPKKKNRGPLPGGRLLKPLSYQIN